MNYTEMDVECAAQALDWAERKGIKAELDKGGIVLKARSGAIDREVLRTLRGWRHIYLDVMEKVGVSTSVMTFHSFREAFRSLKNGEHPAAPLPTPQPIEAVPLRSPIPHLPDPEPEVPQAATAEKERKARIPDKDRFFAMKLMEANLEKIEGTEYWEYRNGYDDERVRIETVAQSEYELPIESFKHLRQRVFGHLRVHGGPQKLPQEFSEVKQILFRLANAHNMMLDRVATKIPLGEGWQTLKIRLPE